MISPVGVRGLPRFEFDGMLLSGRENVGKVNDLVVHKLD